MNFLGHLYLSGNDDELKIGNFIGDFVKGNPFDRYDGKIVEGIVLHREIDRYTDSHPICQQSKHRLSKKYRHYSGVIVDIYYDHFLAVNWDKFSEIPLDKYADSCYDLMTKNKELLPEKAQFMLNYMIQQNWLVNYTKFEGIQRTLSGMARRTSFQSNMEKAVVELKEHYTLFENEFLAFFADIEKHIREINSKDGH